MLKYFLLYSIFVGFIVCAGPTRAALPLYVSTQGIDPEDCVNCCTDPSLPCRTITFAEGKNEGGNILVARGTYSDEEILVLSDENIFRTIQGGWNESFTEKRSDPSQTLIQGTGEYDSAVFDIGGQAADSNLTIDNFTLSNPPGTGITDTNVVSLHTENAYSLNVVLDNLVIRDARRVGVYLFTTSGGTIDIDIKNSLIVFNNVYGIQALATGHVPDFDPTTIGVNVINTTIAHNGDTSGYGLRLDASNKGRIFANCWNSILWGYKGTLGADLYIRGLTSWPDAEVTVIAEYCDIGTVYNDEGGSYTPSHTISQDPEFVDVDGDDFHLSSNSPCRDTGRSGKWILSNVFALYATQYDFEEDQRFVFLSAPQVCDIGADEYSVNLINQGDVNDDGTVDLEDLIISLKIVAGMDVSGDISVDSDVGDDQKIGLEEALFAFDELSKN